MESARSRWLKQNPFLEPLARFQEAVAAAAAAVPVPPVALPGWEAYRAEYQAGVPLLRSRSHGPALVAAGAEVLGGLAERVLEAKLPAKLLDGCREVRDAAATPEGRARAMAWVVAAEPEGPEPAQPGLLRFLGWIALGRVLAPHAGAYAEWRDDAAWRRAPCPTCGGLPMMAQLVAREAGRERVLVCGCCPTRWTYRRVGCPHCGNEAADRLALLELQGPAGLRLDVCESCKGYLKTYTGEGDEELFLADWPTLVLDAMAAERGYARRGASLYEL
ncbi:MAG TPA: formate dehydrogenase accessory protein FdhE [Anaeromyxobacteraceae bacterium]|nr:formate dehydrogenase accessory protein FdhE [Anaeromyxobacteraceae bacterium]